MIGYMLTWTTYGSWLQGDRRKFVKDGKIIESCEGLEKINKTLEKKEAVRLTKEQRDIVRETIIKEAQRHRQVVHAAAVCSNHVHLLVGNNGKTIDFMAGRYKRETSKVLKENGCEGKVWTRGYDKRFCFSQEDLKNRIGYVERHNR